MNLTSAEQAIFAEALARAAGPEREAYLDEVCAGDVSLRGRLEHVLRSAEQAGSFLEAPVLGDVATQEVTKIIAAAPELPGDQIGRYRLLQQIGEGGCGVVYMAEQEEPVRRKVALKVIKLGMDTRMVIARFELERQALALMDHPNIARVLDAGATTTGRPYFVMELVRGVRITDYCDQARLDTASRLALFVQVCHAVQHAHQKGIIHRDLKPSNILVTMHDGVPVPKVIDFGIAKATTGQRLTDKTLFTAYEQFLGTPAYMSPEQAEMSGLDIDTRTDIYSLGVLLYELLTGRTPFSADELMSEGLDGMRRTIREREPVRPSARLSTMGMAEGVDFAKGRRESLQRVASVVRGDLDWIVMKALEKDRSRRYETASGLALDVRRYLSCETVSARPPSAVYRLQKALRRNKLSFLSLAAVFIALAAGLGASLWQGARAERESSRARRALAELRSTAPAFAEQARALVTHERFDEAVQKLDYAARLCPDEPGYLLAKADLLQAQMKLDEALAAYRGVLALAPGHARAATNAALCAQLLAAPRDQDALSAESLALLHSAMEEQQRPAAELMPVSRLLGVKNDRLVTYWLDRLRDLPISGAVPLKDRLVMRETGRLALDLSETSVTDLKLLEGMPLGWLALTGCSGVRDLGPLRGAPLRTLLLARTGVRDLEPLRRMEHLTFLNLAMTEVSDLSPLAGKPLRELNLSGCREVGDLNALRGLPLEVLFLRSSRVTDLSPIRGMPLKLLDVTGSAVTDLSPLAGLRLETLSLQGLRIRDLSIVRGMPLRELQLTGCREVRGLEVLSSLGNLEILSLPVEYRSFPETEQEAIAALRRHPRLRQLVAEIMDGMNLGAAPSTAEFWRDWDREQGMVRPLRAAGIQDFFLTRLTDGTYELRLSRQPVRDLSLLPPESPISRLYLTGTQVRDLAPVARFPLRLLELTETPVVSLEPLAGSRLEQLYLSGTRVTNLAPLASMPLTVLYLQNVRAPDVAPLASIRTLESVLLPTVATNVETLKSLPALRRISFHWHQESSQVAETAGEFWASVGPIQELRRELTAAGIKFHLEPVPGGRWNLDINDPRFTDLSRLGGLPLHGLGLDRSGVRDITVVRDWPLAVLELRETGLAELPDLRDSVLASSLKELRLSRTPLREVGPLAACRKLELLDIGNTKVSDLTPLHGLALQRVYLSGTAVADLRPLLGLPLRTLYLDRCAAVKDVALLAGMSNLRELLLPEGVGGLEPLRGLRRLERVGYRWKSGVGPATTAKEFWAEHDASAGRPAP